MDVKEQQADGTNCFLGLWSSAETQNKRVGVERT